MGYEFKDRDADDNIVIKVKQDGQRSEIRYKLLDVCEFTSSRKRMSCILQRVGGKEDGQIILMCKGADSVIEELLSERTKQDPIFKTTQDEVDKYAS